MRALLEEIETIKRTARVSEDAETAAVERAARSDITGGALGFSDVALGGRSATSVLSDAAGAVKGFLLSRGGVGFASVAGDEPINEFEAGLALPTNFL